jgi:hypothetical protein
MDWCRCEVPPRFFLYHFESVKFFCAHPVHWDFQRVGCVDRRGDETGVGSLDRVTRPPLVTAVVKLWVVSS